MSEKELLQFISRIIACGESKNISLSLAELRQILEREEADPELLKTIEEAIEASPELSEIGKTKFGADITKKEFGKAIRDAYERRRRSGC